MAAALFVRLLVVLILLIIGLISTASSSSSSSLDGEVLQHEAHLDSLFRRGEAAAMIDYATQVLSDVPEVERNSTLYGSVHKYLGAALHSLGRLDQATQAFALATIARSDDVENWMLLADTLLHQMRAPEAAAVLEQALLVRRLSPNLSKLFKARLWTCNWRGYDVVEDNIRRYIASNLKEKRPPGVGSAEFTNVDLQTLMQICSAQPNSQEVDALLWHHHHPHGSNTSSSIWSSSTSSSSSAGGAAPRHRIGFISSDLGVHPVSSLIRGFLSMLNKTHFEVHVYCLSPAKSWWRTNITAEVEFLQSLYGLSPAQAAKVIADDGIHTLVDLNGHTMHSGLPVLAYRPSPVQISYLGSPITTGARFVDYIITDRMASQPWTAPYYSEHFMFVPPSYMVNDHAQLMDHVLHRPRRRQHQQQSVNDKEDDDADDGSSFLFASFSNFLKMDPEIFGVWSNVLRRVPSSRLSMMQYQLHEEASTNLRSEAASRGIQAQRRLEFQPQEPWIDHVWGKTHVDLALDTTSKNGHTTSLDTLWAGVPLITGPHKERMDTRAGASFYAGLKGEGLEETMTVHSLKEYEDLAVELARGGRGNGRLAQIRAKLEAMRSSTPLFKTHDWTSYAEAAFDAGLEVKAVTGNAWHLWVEEEGLGQRDSRKKQGEQQGAVILLHIGGLEAKKDWTLVNIMNGPHVDLVASMDNLQGVSNSSVTAIYASHCLEHVSHGVGRGLEKTLAEWHRVLKHGGVSLISVPDLRVLSSLFLNETLSLSQRAHVMRMIYGGQVDGNDFHLVGFDVHLLSAYLSKAGFCDIREVKGAGFGLFNDSSDLSYLGHRISLNVIATACKESSSEPRISVNLVGDDSRPILPPAV